MHKKNYYLLISAFVSIILFATAAVCTMCGRQYDINFGSAETGEAGEQDGNDTGQNNQPDTEQGQQGQDEGTQPEGGNNESNTDSENNAPVIESMNIGPMDIELAVSEGYFESLPPAEREGIQMTIDVLALDDENDELQYICYDSNDNDFDIEKTDNNHAEISWIVPHEPGQYSLTIEVSDGTGGQDSFTIEMNFTNAAGPTERRDTGEIILRVVGDETGTILLDASSAVVNDIFVGDDTSNRYYNGYISFDISAIAGLEVANAALIMVLDREYPGKEFLGNLRLGLLDYGVGAISPSDGDISAEMIMQYPNSVNDINFSSDILAQRLQEKMNSGNERFQFKVYWSHPGSNGDSIANGLRYNKWDISLLIGYYE